MTATIITSDDLQQFKHELLEEIKALMLGKSAAQKQWLKSSEVRELLKISPGTLQNLRVNGHLPYTKIGGTIFYAFEDVQNMINEHKRN
ncbi:MAG: helix-turn-helix domain-containing protein [Fulvivirga sp.]